MCGGFARWHNSLQGVIAVWSGGAHEPRNRTQPAGYHQDAEELRVIAASKQSKVNREALLRIAEDYERMAASLHAIDATNKKLRNRPPG